MSRTSVEKLRLSVAMSAVMHAAAVGWVVTRAFTPAPVPAEATTPIEVVTIDRPALDPASADAEPATEMAQPIAPQPPRIAGPHRDVVAIAVLAAAAAAGPTGEMPPPSPNSLLRMRGGEAPRLELPAGRWDDLDHVPSGTTAERSRTTGQLRESGGGSYRFEHGGFVARVSPDGAVALRDKPSANIHLALPTPKQLGGALAQWYESDKGRFGEGGDTAMGKQIQVSPGAAADPGNIATNDSGDRAPTVIVPVLTGGIDVTDWLMRRHGQDPYASKKLAFLDATRDERAQIGTRHRARQLALTPQIVQRNLGALWAATHDPRARKQALFELWDECAETGDPNVVAGGDAARRLVIAFIRTHLPAGSASAYTPAELAELARTRQSKAAFAPYDEAPSP